MQPRRQGRETEFVTPRLAYGFVVLVGGSAGLMAGAAGASLTEGALLVAVGLAVGVVLLLAVGVNPWAE
jgi:hypothetical protein